MTQSLFTATVESLPKWFHDEIERREEEGLPFEIGHDSRKWLICGHAGVAVEGPTWAFATEYERIFNNEAVQRPLVRLTPGPPVAHTAPHNLAPALLKSHPDLAAHFIPMGAHYVHIVLGYYLLVTCAFGDRVEWFGSGPCDAVVAKRGGRLVAIVMPCFGPDRDEHEQGIRAAVQLQAMRAQMEVASGYK